MKIIAEIFLDIFACLIVLACVVSAFLCGGFLIGIIYRLVRTGFKFGAGF